MFKQLIEPALDPFPLLNGHVHARMRGAAWHRGDFLVSCTPKCAPCCLW